MFSLQSRLSASSLSFSFDLMADAKAADHTIIGLFEAYKKSGMQNHHAIMLIAASLGLLQKDVLDVLEARGVYDKSIQIEG